ncbi:hypothetical protein PRIPAC_83203 [Pristionchus pacificus]|uniref:Uncharacterized protein n=1 Tax=Pristionchus pacificus TaxID=54126 RepID=A0A2A6BLH1_PRIPA|nr:hypothetical protein PRIPAC_83203 [Pristionchus pacificus]|eukprot:PDM66755.1 hypothetical protein PRIPAC_48172 [Pristionchus pacificus]
MIASFHKVIDQRGNFGRKERDLRHDWQTLDGVEQCRHVEEEEQDDIDQYVLYARLRVEPHSKGLE